MGENKEAPLKPKYETPETFSTAPMTAVLCNDFDRYSTGHMHMTMEGATVTENGEVVGTIGAIIGGMGGVQIQKGKRTWHISAEEIWKAMQPIFEAE